MRISYLDSPNMPPIGMLGLEAEKKKIKQLGKRQVPTIPHWLALPIALAGNFLGSRAPINSDKLNKITVTLTFDDSRAREAFGWDPKPVLENFRIN